MIYSILGGTEASAVIKLMIYSILGGIEASAVIKLCSSCVFSFLLCFDSVTFIAEKMLHKIS